MREIKFRAWHRSLRKMSYSDSHKDADFWGSKVGDSVLELFCHTFNSLFIDNKDGLLMQYTGLKDKNGKEIYEGDIVIRNGEIASEVFWRRGSYGVRTRMGDMLFTFPEGWEVIGNVYENPELLEGSNV